VLSRKIVFVVNFTTWLTAKLRFSTQNQIS